MLDKIATTGQYNDKWLWEENLKKWITSIARINNIKKVNIQGERIKVSLEQNLYISADFLEGYTLDCVISFIIGLL